MPCHAMPWRLPGWHEAVECLPSCGPKMCPPPACSPRLPRLPPHPAHARSRTVTARRWTACLPLCPSCCPRCTRCAWGLWRHASSSAGLALACPCVDQHLRTSCCAANSTPCMPPSLAVMHGSHASGRMHAFANAACLPTLWRCSRQDARRRSTLTCSSATSGRPLAGRGAAHLAQPVASRAGPGEGERLRSLLHRLLRRCASLGWGGTWLGLVGRGF